MANDNLRNLYNTLKNCGYTPPPYDQFQKDMANEDNLRKVHATLQSEGYTPPAFDTFKADMAVTPTTTAKAGSTSTPQSAPSTVQPQQQVWQPGAAQMAAFHNQVEQGQRRLRQQFEAGQQRMENIMEYGRSGAGLAGAPAKSKTRTWNPETNKFEETYLTPYGGRMTSKPVAEFATRHWNEAMDMTVSGQLRRANRELADLRRQYGESASRVHGEWAEDYEKNDAPLAAVLAAQTYTPRQQSDRENSALRVAIRQKEEQIKDLQEQLDRDNGVDVGFWRGFGRTVGDIRTWDFGRGDLMDAMTMLNAGHYTSDKATEGEKRAGQEMMQALYDKQQVEQMYGGNASFWNRAGVVAGHMPSFMIDFSLTGGGYEAVNVFGKTATKGAVKWVGKDAVEEMARTGFRTYVKKYGAKGLGREAMNWTIKATGTTADELLIRAPLMANTVQAADVAADVIDRKLGDVAVDENGNYNFTNDRTWGSAVWQAEANAAVENYSEMFGTHLEGLVPWGKLADALGAKRISGVLARAGSSNYGQILNASKKHFQRLGVSDYFGEVAEEYYGQVWRTMLNLDDAYQINPDGTRTNLLATGQFHGDIWGGMALSMGLMGAGKYTLSSAAYGHMKHKVNKADKRASGIIGADEWEALRSIIDNTPNENMGAFAEVVMDDGDWTKEQRGAVMDYMERSMNLRGLNLATLAQSRGHEGSPDEQEINESYLDGHSVRSPQEMNDAKNAFEYQRQHLGELWPEKDRGDMFDWIDQDPIAALQHARQSWDGEGVEMLLDYVNSKMVYEGMMQGVRDGIDEQIAASDAMIEGRVNNSTGQIHPATMKMDDRKVYVVGGLLAVNEDGTIDNEASAESLVIRDADTGELEFTDPSAILSGEAEIDPNEQKQTAAQQIREEYARRAADHIDGVLQFKPGDKYTINDGSGQLVDVTLVGPAVNEEGAQLSGQYIVQWPNGSTTIFDRQTLQTMADAANLERLYRFEQQRQQQRQERRAAEAEANRPQYNINDELLLEVDGQMVRGSVTATENEDGLIEVFTEDPINGQKVNMFTREELDRMLHEQRQAVPETYSNAENEQQPQSEAEMQPEANMQTEDQQPTGPVEPQAPQRTALEQIPANEEGKPNFAAAETPELGWDALVEKTQGDGEMAKIFADNMVSSKEKALAKAEKAKPKAIDDIDEFMESERQRKAAVEQARYELEMWRRIAAVKQNRQREIDRQHEEGMRRRAGEARIRGEKERAAREEAGRIEREALEGVPDWAHDTPANARKRGYRRFNGQKIDRQEPTAQDDKGFGKEVEPMFRAGDTPVSAKGRVFVGNVGDFQPSHLDGRQNPAHFGDEWQPKKRHEDGGVSGHNADANARNFRAELATRFEDAFSGAPIVNARREGIQGNNRLQMFRYLYDRYPEHARNYKQYLIDHAEDFGVDPEYIRSLERPIATMMVDVSDKEANILGNIDDKEMTSGGKEELRPKNIVHKLGDRMRTFASILLRTADDEASFSELVAKNGLEALKWLSTPFTDKNGRKIQAITDTQYATALDTRGSLTEQAATGLKGVLYQSIFTGASTQTEEYFYKMPAKAQRAILSTAFRDFDSEAKDRMIGEIQQSIIAFNALNADETFRNAKNITGAKQAVQAWKQQYAFDDVSGQPYLPAERFSNFALELAAMYKGQTQSFVQGIFNRMFDIIQGAEEDSLFEKADKTPKSLAEAIERVLGIEYQPIKKKENGHDGSNALDSYSGESETERPGSSGAVESGERNEEGEQSAERGAGASDDSAKDGGNAVSRSSAQRVREIQRPLTESEADEMLSRMETNAVDAPQVELNPQTWNEQFGDEGKVTTPIGEVKMGANQIAKLFEKGRSDQFGMIRPTLTEPLAIIEVPSEAVDGTAERNTSLLFVKTFKGKNGEKIYYFKSVTVKKDGMEVSVSSHYDRPKRIKDALKKGKLLYRFDGGAQTEQRPADVSVTASPENVQGTEDKFQTAASQPHGFTSDGKVNALSEDKQIPGEESSLQPSDDKGAGLEQPSVQASVEAASEAVNTEPTPAQAEAGNYKKGHVTIGDFDITIENPAGSVRRGVDANGEKWQTTMANAYGYIKGTESVDGDHMDVFLAENMDGWDGRKVYVVDQTKPDGAFDEHKVMLGFNDGYDAMQAYLANYDANWLQKHPGIRISEVNTEDFMAWIDSSHRKTKPFADYSAVKKDTSPGEKLLQKSEGKLPDNDIESKTAEAKNRPLSLDDMRSATQSQTGHPTEEKLRAAEKPEAEKAPVNRGGNRLVTDERYAELKAMMRKKLDNLNMGVDPEILAIGTEMAVYHIEKGARRFSQYAKAMIEDLGDAIRPYLKSFYNAVRDLPEAEAAGLVADMDGYEDVRRVDIANFDKSTVDAMATAEMVTKEQEAEKEREEAERKLKEERDNLRSHLGEDSDIVAQESEVEYGGKKSPETTRQDLTTSSLSPSGGAKLRQISDNLSKLSHKFEGKTDKRGIFTDFADAIGATNRSPNSSSDYARLSLPNGKSAEVRISNHNANSETFAKHGSMDGNVSIVIKSRRSRNTFRSHPEVELTEYVYATEAIKADGNLLSQVAESLRQMIETGEYVDLSGKAIVNRSPDVIDMAQKPEAGYGKPQSKAMDAEERRKENRGHFYSLRKKREDARHGTGSEAKTAREPDILYDPGQIGKFASRYETAEGKTVIYASERRLDSYQPSLFDFDLSADSGSGQSYNVRPRSNRVQRETNPLLRRYGNRLKKKEGEFCHVERVFRESRSFDFTVGNEVNGPEDVAFIFSQLENAGVEHSFAVFVKDGKPTVVELCMGHYNVTMVNIPAIKEAYHRIKPDTVYFVHNHPSGNLAYSPQDRSLIEKVEEALDHKVVGVIVNLKTGHFGTFDSSGNRQLRDKATPAETRPLKIYSFDRQVFADDFDPMLLETMNSAAAVSAFIQSHRLGGRDKVSILVANQANRIVANVHTTFADSSAKGLADAIVHHINTFGGKTAFLYGTNVHSKDFDRLKNAVEKASGGSPQMGGFTILDFVRVLSEHKGDYLSAQEGDLFRLGDSAETFAERQASAVKTRGTVMPGLNETVVEIVDVPEHTFDGEKPISQAKAWAKENIVGEHEASRPDGSTYVYTISNKAIGKYLSESAIGKSNNLGVHLSALTKLPEIIKKSIDAEVHADYKKGTDGVRRVENGFYSDNLIHRLYGAIGIDGQTYRVKTTMVEAADKGAATKPHSYEVTELELLISGPDRGDALSSSNVEPKASTTSRAPLGVAKLLNGVEKSYDKGVKLLDASDVLNAEMRSRQTLKESSDKKPNNLEPGATYGAEGEDLHRTMEEVGRKFDADIDRYERGELPVGYRFELGMPSAVLRSAGFSNLPISMRKTLLEKKSQQPNHPFVARDIKGLVEAIQEPVAIFEYTKPDVRNLIVGIEKDGKHFLVGVTLDFKRSGLEIHSISGLFPKQNHEWLKWIQDGKAIRIDQKEKVLGLIDSLRINPAEAERIGLDLDSVAKIVENFENPAILSNLSQKFEGKTGKRGVWFRLGDSAETFGERLDAAVMNRGTVMPGLNDAEVEIVEVPRHSYVGHDVLTQAVDAAAKRYGGKTLHYDNHGAEFDYIIRPETLKYAANHSHKSENIGVHTAVMDMLDSVINGSVEVMEHADVHIANGFRSEDNGFDPNGLMHRFVGAVKIDGQTYRVLSTLKEYRGDKANSHHTYEVVKIEVVDTEAPITSTATTTEGKPRIEVANLLKGTEIHNKSGERILQESRNYDSGTEETRLTPQQRMSGYVRELADRLHLDNVDIVEDASQLKGKRARAKGFYTRSTGRITIVPGNNRDAGDVERTLLHEAVAHFGLRRMFGKAFSTFLDNVYESATPTIRKKIAALAAANGWDFRTATEEYLAGLAEDTNFEEAKRESWWTKVKRMFKEMLRSIGMEGFAERGVKLTDNELRYMLWSSYQNLKGENEGIMGEAADITMQDKLGVGEFAEPKRPTSSTEELAEAERVNAQFNREIKMQIEGKLPGGHIYELGMPGRILLSTGVPDLPIQMNAARLHYKATGAGHNFDISEVNDLVLSLQKPVAVFAYGDKGKAQNVILEVSHNGKNFVVGLSLRPTVKGNVLEINSVRTVYPKDNHEWLKWISDGLLLYVDKEKIQPILTQQRMTLADVERIGLDLKDVAKIVENFENPPVPGYERTVEEDDLFRDGDFSERDKAIARDAYNRICESGSFQFREAMQDSMLGLKKLYEAILTGGDRTKRRDFRIEEVAGFENAYLYENRMSSTNASEQYEYFIRYMKPLIKAIGAITGKSKPERGKLTDYMMAKHGLERNEYMRNEAAANGEDTDRDFAGLCGLTGMAGWRDAEAEARRIVDDYESAHDAWLIDELWEKTNAATKASLEKIYLSGILSTETYEKVRGMYEYYIPLRGWEETTSDEVYGYLTSHDGPLMDIMKSAHGRDSKAADPIATIGMMADAAIRQGNRNVMKQRFLNFVLNHQSDAVSVNDFWLAYNAVRDEWEPQFANLTPDMSAEEVEAELEKFEARIEALAQVEPDKYKRGREAANIPYKVVKGNLREHQVFIKRAGRTYVVTINGNPRAAQALNGLTNPDVETSGVIGDMMKAGEWVNRQLSAFYTTRNPEFVVSNFFRDMLYSNCMTWVKENPRYALRFHQNFARVNPVEMRILLGKWTSGTLDHSNALEEMFYQFMKNGGETGYTSVKDIEGYKKTVADELKKQGSVGKKAWSALGMQLELLNRSAENCARFAAFVTSREFGRSIDRSIYDAKEVSVNFNKKGSGGKMVNAVGQTWQGKVGSYLGGIGRVAFVFWNAGVQGMTNFGRAAVRHPGKATAGAAALFTLGYVIPILAQMLGGGDGDDDDKNAYYNLPEYVRRSNICFKAGDQWITIPLPIEYRSIYGLGELMYGVVSGNERYSDSELAFHMASQVSQIMPVDMLEGGGGVSPLIPSIPKPLIEAYIMNKGWTGLPVYKDTPFNKTDPEWTKAYASADQHLVQFTKWLNEVSGGDDYKKGAIDINPAKIEYLLNGYLGGAFTFPNKVKKAGETAFGDREFEWRNMPIANSVIKSGDERTANRKLQNEYFKYKDEYEATGKLARKYENAKADGIMGYAEKVDFLYNSPEYLRYGIFYTFKPTIDAYSEAIDAETDPKKRSQIEAKKYEVMRELVDALHDPEEYMKAVAAEGEDE